MQPSKMRHLVVKHSDGWIVLVEGTHPASSVTQTQHEAIDLAIEMAAKEGTDVIVHDQDGRIQTVYQGGLPQHERLKALFAQWEAEGDDTPDEWWDEFDAFLRANRVTFTPREN